MKIYSNEKIDNVREMKLFGFPIFSVEKNRGTKLQSFLGGIVTAYKTFREDYVTKDIKFLGISTYRYIREANDVKCFLFNILYKQKSLGKLFCKEYKKLLSNHDDVFILHANIGESVIFLRLARAYFKKMGSKTPLIIGLQNYHRDLVKMLLPEANVEIIKRIKISMYSDGFSEEGHNVRLIFPKSHYDKVEADLRDKNAPVKHFVDQILLKLGLNKSDFSDEEVHIEESVKTSLLKKVQKIGLNIDKFIFISPEANTCEAYDRTFWYNLKQESEKEGIDVYCNTRACNPDFKGFKHCDLNLCEAYYLASRAQKIIGLRSGILDLLALSGKPIIALYTKARKRPAFDMLTLDEMLEGFNMKNVVNVTEYNTDKFNREALEKHIKEDLCIHY